PLPPPACLAAYTLPLPTLFRSTLLAARPDLHHRIARLVIMGGALTHGNSSAAAEFNVWSDPEDAHRVLTGGEVPKLPCVSAPPIDRKSTRLNSSHVKISYAVFC